ncbi:MAG: hypothetical protein IPG66_18295 [Hydrogenophilales bacterium]|nr:hypothetical protein [Hydrogenophilales bacterium]
MIAAETLEHIAAATAALPALDDAGLEALRQAWPDTHFTLCGDNDVPARLPPALERPGFNLYLINGSEHCLSLTTDPDVAIGVVIAWTEAE